MLVEKVSAAATYGGGGTAVVFGLTPSEWQVAGVICGLLVGLAGLLVNIWFKHQHLKLAKKRAGVGDAD